MVYAGSSSSTRQAEGAGSILRLLGYLGVALLLMVIDHRGDWLAEFRRQASQAVTPLYWLASAPVRGAALAQEQFASRQRLNRENQDLRSELLLANARLYRLEAVAQENQRLRELMGGTRGYQLDVQLATVLDVDLDPFRQRVLIDLGARDGLRMGQAVIDAGGLAGQVIDVQPGRSVALLVTDPDHAVPVQVVRSGLRVVVYGTGERDRLFIPNIPQSGDIRDGDRLITSGIGGGFPAGFPVGTVTALRSDATDVFIEADVRPATYAERSGEVLVVGHPRRVLPEPVGPPADTQGPQP